MRNRWTHAWNVTPAEARAIQVRFRARVSRRKFRGPVRHVAGVDISVKDGRARAAIVVLRFPELEIAEIVLSEQPVPFPYVPGLLSFREIPSILQAAKQLAIQPDLLLIDGQGIAHPRRFGLASHLGVLLDKPTIGCAKSRYIGAHDEPDLEAGCYTDLFDGEELIGAVLRTRTDEVGAPGGGRDVAVVLKASRVVLDRGAPWTRTSRLADGTLRR